MVYIIFQLLYVRELDSSNLIGTSDKIKLKFDYTDSWSISGVARITTLIRVCHSNGFTKNMAFVMCTVSE